MNDLLARTILPRYWKGVKKDNGKANEKIIPCSFDTETFYGKVFAVGFKTESNTWYSHGLTKDHLGWLLNQIRSVLLESPQKSVVVVSAHYLKFDLGVLLWETLNPFGHVSQKAPLTSWLSLIREGCTLKIIWGNPCFGSIEFQEFPKRRVIFLDTKSFYPMSLEKALETIDAPVRKLGKPPGLGKRVIPMRELKPYLEGDIEGDYELLKRIIDLHRQYDCRLCISLPMLSGRIFRRHYLVKDFVVLSTALIGPAMLSYHGGKNNFNGDAGWYPDCWDLDTNSAFSEAMRQLPDFQYGKWIFYGKIGFNPEKIIPHGIYRVAGLLKICKWGVLFSHDFKPLRGKILSVWVSGYELIEAIKSGEFIPSKIEGWVFKQEKAGKNRKISPWIKFVDYFFKMKSQAKTPGERLFFKLILNALYGKFVQRVEDENGEFTAGGMFDPAVASLITGYVRAKVHRLEHRYRAIHTATDGILTQECPNISDINEKLGGLKIVNFGPCLILRNKLYLHYDKEGNLKKTGLHGFEPAKIGENPQESAERLIKLWNSADRTYRIERLSRWAESWHIKIPPGQPVFRTRKLEIKKNSIDNQTFISV